jgi:integrase
MRDPAEKSRQSMNLPATEPVVPLMLPAALDGHDGTNRARGANRQITADTDLEAVRLWLAEYASSPHAAQPQGSGAAARLGDAHAGQAAVEPYARRFPDLRAISCRTVRKLGRSRPATARGTRRLFDGPLSERSRRQALGILCGLLNYLVAAGYLAGNPLALRRSSSAMPARTRRIERYLDHALWQVVLESMETWPQASARERQHTNAADG